jgi:hypothetical protein
MLAPQRRRRRTVFARGTSKRLFLGARPRARHGTVLCVARAEPTVLPDSCTRLVTVSTIRHPRPCDPPVRCVSLRVVRADVAIGTASLLVAFAVTHWCRCDDACLDRCFASGHLALQPAGWTSGRDRTVRSRPSPASIAHPTTSTKWCPDRSDARDRHTLAAVCFAGRRDNTRVKPRMHHPPASRRTFRSDQRVRTRHLRNFNPAPDDTVTSPILADRPGGRRATTSSRGSRFPERRNTSGRRRLVVASTCAVCSTPPVTARDPTVKSGVPLGWLSCCS